MHEDDAVQYNQKESELHQLILKRFNLDELRTLCMRLGVSYDNLSGDNLSAKARELVLYMRRQGRLGDLEREISRASSPLIPPAEPRIGIIARAALVLIAFGFIVALYIWFVNGRSPTSDAHPTPFIYQVSVRDAETDEPLKNAHVIIEVGGIAPPDDFTDDGGIAVVSIPSTAIEQRGRLSVSLEGYEAYTQNITLNAGELPDQIRLRPVQ